MPKLTKRVVDAAESRSFDYFIWDQELPGFGLRVFKSGSEAILFNTGRQEGHAVTQSVFTVPGLLRPRARRRARFSGGLLRVRIPRRSADSMPRQLR